MKSKLLLILTLAAIILASGCIKPPQPTATPTTTPESTAIPTLTPTATPQALPTATPTQAQLPKDPTTVQLEDITQLTFVDYLAGDPDYSPDATRIVFFGMEKDLMQGGLCIMNSDGTGIAKIPGQWGKDHLFNPSWNPVNNKIACHGPSSSPGPGGNGLFLVDLDADQAKRTQVTEQVVEYASWSPDGKKIAYNVFQEYNTSSKRYKHSSIWLVNEDGSEKTQLTTSEDGFCSGPSFSYDGSKIAYLKGFISSMPGPKSEDSINEIWVMNSDGTGKHMIYAPGDSAQLMRERAWNKGDKIIFAKHKPKRSPQIWVINSDGTEPRCILNPDEKGMPTAIYDDPVWDSTGTKVAVTKVMLSDESWQIATFPWDAPAQKPSTPVPSVPEPWDDLDLIQAAPEKASVSRVVYLSSPACAMGATAMLISKIDPQVTPDSLASSQGYTKQAGGYLNPEKNRPFMPADLYSLVSGAGHKLYIGYFNEKNILDKGNPYQQYIGKMGSKYVKEFTSKEDALGTLKKAVASGHPVGVVIDFNDLHRAFDPSWTDVPAEPDHYMAVVGYDAASVFLNDPNIESTQATENWEVPWGVFTTAWEDTYSERTEGFSSEPGGKGLTGFPGAYMMYVIVE